MARPRCSISFHVSEPGVPVLVKTSYFPSWQASGADGPYRVAPNLMVVVPTATHVELRYGRTPVDWLAWLVTLVGIVGVVMLRRRPPLLYPEPLRVPVQPVPSAPPAQEDPPTPTL